MQLAQLARFWNKETTSGVERFIVFLSQQERI